MTTLIEIYGTIIFAIILAYSLSKLHNVLRTYWPLGAENILRNRWLTLLLYIVLTVLSVKNLVTVEAVVHKPLMLAFYTLFAIHCSWEMFHLEETEK